MKKWLLSVSLLSLAIFLVFWFVVPHRGSIAENIWKKTHSEQLAFLINGGDAHLAFAIAEYYFNHGSYDIKKAEYSYTRAIKLDPQYKEAYYQRGRIFFIHGRFGSALTDIKTVLALDPEFKKAYYMYGLISGYAGDFDQAEYGFREFIKRDSFNWAGYNDLAWIYFKQGEFVKTRDTARLGLTQAPTNPWLNNIYGTALMNLGDTVGARSAFEAALTESEQMSGADWGRAYPGNDPTLYQSGIEETRSVIRHNLSLLPS